MIPRWLDPTTYGLLILGTVGFLVGMVLLFWPRRQREIVYVVEPSQVPEIAARWNGPTPVPGMYRSASVPPTITPSFAWPPVPAPPAG
jgi:hypothetical protein